MRESCLVDTQSTMKIKWPFKEATNTICIRRREKNSKQVSEKKSLKSDIFKQWESMGSLMGGKQDKE